jgi:hypothetical protein
MANWIFKFQVITTQQKKNKSLYFLLLLAVALFVLVCVCLCEFLLFFFGYLSKLF